MLPTQATVRAAVRAVTVILPLAMLGGVGVGWWAAGTSPPVAIDSLGVRLDGARVVRVPDPDDDERRLERAAAALSPAPARARFSLMDHGDARYVVGHVTVPSGAEIPAASRLLLTVSQPDPVRTSSWTWIHGEPVAIGWSGSLDDATAEVPWLSRRGTWPTAAPSAVELRPGDDVVVYAGLAPGTRSRSLQDVTVGLVWLGPGGRLWDHRRLG